MPPKIAHSHQHVKIIRESHGNRTIFNPKSLYEVQRGDDLDIELLLGSYLERQYPMELAKFKETLHEEANTERQHIASQASGMLATSEHQNEEENLVKKEGEHSKVKKTDRKPQKNLQKYPPRIDVESSSMFEQTSQHKMQTRTQSMQKARIRRKFGEQSVFLPEDSFDVQRGDDPKLERWDGFGLEKCYSQELKKFKKTSLQKATAKRNKKRQHI